MKRKMIIDTDAGLDDAYAILMALALDDVDVVAITTVLGNTGAQQVAKNVLRILKLADRLDVPVYVGCDQTLIGNMFEECHGYHGCDGFGDSPDPKAPDPSIINKEEGVSALIRLTKEHIGEITLVCIGPLTNIATAIKRDKTFGSRLKECFIMGGNYYGRGNVTAAAEFNFHFDPEAARAVLQHLSCPKTILGWEICTENPFTWDWYKTFLQIKSPKVQYLAKLEKYAIDKYYMPKIKKGIEQQYEMADQFLMAVALDANVCVESKDVYADVELKGEITRAQMVVDWNKKFEKELNVKIVTKIDKNLAENMLLDALK